MRRSKGFPSRIDLKEDAKRCGDCGFCARYEVLISASDMARLKEASAQVLAAEPTGPILRSESVIDLLCFAKHLLYETVYCVKEKVWTRVLEPSCSFWRPRVPNTEENQDSEVLRRTSLCSS
jgi:hypothetical protein